MLQENHAEPPVRDDKSRGGLKRIWNAMFYSFEGIGSSLKHESAFRQEMLLACILVPTAIMLPVGLIGKALMIGSIFLVLIVELCNSALEWTVDYISQETHPFAKRAKDMGSGAVFFSLVNVLVMWSLVISDAVQQGKLVFNW